MTSSRRAWLPAVLTAFVLTGCSYTIQGDPLAEPGFVPPSTTAASSSASAAGAPKIAKQRTVAGVDPCTLLDANDLKSIGPYKKEPTRKDDVIQESCQYILEDGSPSGRTVATALYQKYEQVRDRQKKGSEKVVDGHSTWTLCELSGDEEVCTATIAVNANRSILVAMTQRSGDPAKMLAVMEPLCRAALARIPVA